MDKKYDVIVIGGGPSGMMAAGRAAEMGARVLLLEKNDKLGKKLLITGKGRCNLTQAEFDDKEIIKKFGRQGKFLFSSLALFGPEETMNFFEEKNVPLKTERGGRVFPVSDRSADVLRALQGYLKKNKVEVRLESAVLGLEMDRNDKKKRIAGLRLTDGTVLADKFILAVGGKSYAATGSTGDGYQWAQGCGHRIVKTNPALVPIKTKEAWVKEVQGLSLKNVEINLIQNNKKIDSRFGEMIFTHFGLSGPIVLDVSKKIIELSENKEKVIVSIDLKPALDRDQLDKRLQRDFMEYANKDFANYLPELLPQKMVGVFISLLKIDAKKKNNAITKVERWKIIELLKNLPLTADGHTGYEQAIVTSGGVDTKEVDSKTMRSKIVENLFFTGEILDLDGPTGGYNLQMCWSTGYAAGTYVMGSPIK
jgi:hypothetical protein